MSDREYDEEFEQIRKSTISALQDIYNSLPDSDEPLTENEVADFQKRCENAVG